MWTGMKLSLCKNSNEVLKTRNTSINECFLWNKIKVKPHLSLIKLAWILPHSDESFALFNYSPCWGQKWRALKFITDTLLNLSVLINHSFKVSSPDTLRKLIFPADLSAQIVKLDTLLLQNVSTDACAGVAVCTRACMCFWDLKEASGFCVATRNFIILYLLKTCKSKSCPCLFIFSMGRKSYQKYEVSSLKAWYEGN